MATETGKGSAISNAIGILIASALLFVGLSGVNSNWYYPYRQFQSSASWERVPCTVLAIRVDEVATKKSNPTHYVPIVDFRYGHSGKDFASTRFWFGSNETTDKNKAIQSTAAYQPNGQYECFADASNPENAVLLRELNPAPGWLVRNYAIAAGIGVIMWFGHIASFLMRCFRTTTTVSEKNLQRAMVHGTCPVESGEPDEPLIIQAAESRVAVASGLWIGGVCWTGIVSMVSVAALQSKEWGPILILLAFFLIGIALLVGAVYTTLQVFNPTPILACSQRDIYPGSEFELSWMFRGNVKKIKHLEIVLEGIEKVSYRQGTSNRTEEKIFFKQQVVDADSAEIVFQGFEIISIPISTMHSFKSANNSFTWQIRVNGRISLWPDIRDRFEIVLLAPKSSAADFASGAKRASDS